jgi:hypothetical protein
MVEETRIVETVPDFLSEINLCESLEEFTTLGMAIRKQKDHAQWALGLLALKVESKYGEKTIASFAKSIGVSASSMMVYRWVAQQYTQSDPAFTPPERLAFSVLQSVAKLPPEERTKFLEKAEDESMSVERVRQEVKKTTGGTPKPKFHLVECSIHGKWQFVPEDPTQWEPAHDA